METLSKDLCGLLLLSKDLTAIDFKRLILSKVNNKITELVETDELLYKERMKIDFYYIERHSKKHPEETHKNRYNRVYNIFHNLTERNLSNIRETLFGNFWEYLKDDYKKQLFHSLFNHLVKSVSEIISGTSKEIDYEHDIKNLKTEYAKEIILRHTNYQLGNISINDILISDFPLADEYGRNWENIQDNIERNTTDEYIDLLMEMYEYIKENIIE